MAGSTKVFTALLERCQARNMIALVRLVVRQRTSVALAALVPQKEVLDETNAQMLPPGFLVYHLPFAGELTVDFCSHSFYLFFYLDFVFIFYFI
ncbi:X-ray repair cross-complementing protein 5 [Portunus trituberculatus]|uniref:X-ray repair cross-complementing protein 5 n=1 Tax=Portunus trituberculatus TaxID=210409 RepID=A0A5B7ICL9_PORTR|nr:X-ray repair cross-complementing protein 5 [Portunus trituberculatus]